VLVVGFSSIVVGGALALAQTNSSRFSPTPRSRSTAYIDAALALALLSFTATLVAANHVVRGRPF
jgi:hypothetical protein